MIKNYLFYNKFLNPRNKNDDKFYFIYKPGKETPGREVIKCFIDKDEFIFIITINGKLHPIEPKIMF